MKTTEFHELDLAIGEAHLVTNPPPEAAELAQGFVEWLGDKCVALYGDQGKLVVRSKNFVLPVDPDVSSSFGGSSGMRTLAFKKGGRPVYTIVYPDPLDPPIEEDFTAAEAEDFDFGMFIHNVINSLERRRFFQHEWL